MTDDAPSRAGVRSPVPAGQHGVMSRLESMWQSLRRWVVDRPCTETAISEVGTVRPGRLSHPISATATATPSSGGRWSGRGELIGRASSLVWLVFVAFPLTQLYADRSAGLVHTIVVTVVATMFVGLVAVLMLLPQSGSEALSPPTATALIGALWVLTAFLAYFDRPSWVYEFIFSVFPAVHLLGRRARTVLVVDGVALFVGITAGLGAVDILFVMLLIAGTATSVFGVSRLIEANHALKRAQADEARIAVAEERLRFARDLHDLLGHSLSVITLKSEVASRLMAADVRRATQEVGEIHQIARQALREVREAVNGYRQATIAIELAGARTALAAASIRWHEEIDSVELPEDSEAVLAWALREGVTNVVRHARATSCAVTLVADEEEVTATVSDDGRADGPVTFGNGLGGLGERVAAVGGTFSAGPRPGGGFRLRVTVPRCPAAGAAAGRAPAASGPSAGPDASGGPGVVGRLVPGGLGAPGGPMARAGEVATDGVAGVPAGAAGSAPGNKPADRLAPLPARRPEPELGPLRGA